MKVIRQILRLGLVRAECMLGLATVIACFTLTACYNDKVFDTNTVYQRGSGQPLDFQSEQVSIRPEVLNCAVDAGLFESPQYVGSRTVAKLTEKGRALGFTDDVSIGEPGYDLPYTQIRGTFPVEFKKVVKIRDVEKGVKRVEAEAGVKIAHECFRDPLPLMGIHNGNIAEDSPAAFEFDQYGDDWRMMNVLH
jgi:hypothetical protein